MQIGDTVRLKSGGPLMTVKSIEGDSIVCEWFDGNNVKTASFNINQLDKEDF